MIEKVTMPKIGMMEGDINLGEWLVREGEKVDVDMELCEIESQKITNRVKAKTSGTVLKILVDEGTEVPIGTVIAIIGEPGDAIS
jgi:pyruvate/2-oxoglutarate dehydrogenase complex dihydrolipoamide acyltransferase (E2) component